MIERMISRKDAINLLLSEEESTRKLIPSDASWKIAEAVVPILKIMEVIASVCDY
jgi:hypothetical protein